MTAAGVMVGFVALALEDDERSTGIRGRVLGGCWRPDICLGVPIRASQVVYRKADGRLERVTSFKSGRDGTFAVDLPPGRYVILASPGQRWGHLRRSEIVVGASQTTTVALTYNTGGSSKSYRR
jgi:hypothetical protein